MTTYSVEIIKIGHALIDASNPSQAEEIVRAQEAEGFVDMDLTVTVRQPNACTPENFGVPLIIGPY